MSNTISPNMNLIIPGVGNEAGPTYAVDINNSLTIIDQHNHSPGSGVQITNSGININSPFTLNNNTLINAAALTLVAQNTKPANGSVFQDADGFLRYVDLNTGTSIQITNSSGVAGSPGTIADLVSPASATYDGTNTFIWQSNVNIAANMDFGSAILRNLSPNSTFALTLSPPAALSSNYNIVLPTLPPSQSFLTIDNSGNMAAPVVYPLPASGIANGTITTTQISSTAGILGSQLSASANIAGSQLSASAGIVGTQLVAGTINSTELASGAVTVTKQNFYSGTSYAPTVTVLGGGAGANIGMFAMLFTTAGGQAMATIFGQINITVPSGDVRMSLPAASGNFGNSYQATGTAIDSTGIVTPILALPSSTLVTFTITNSGPVAINFTYIA